MARKDKDNDTLSSDKKAWESLLTNRAEHRRNWGNIDEMLLVRYEAGECTEKEKARVEQAMRDYPAVRMSIELGRQLAALEEPNDAGEEPRNKRSGGGSQPDRKDRPGERDKKGKEPSR